MKKNSQQLAYKLFIALSVLGIIVSLYLLENHYVGVEKGSACDFNESVSCSLVNTSIYSELFNVPVALFGVLWFVVLLGLGWKGLKNGREIPTFLVVWSLIGLLSVFYLVAAEIILRAICPFCTLVHIIVLTVLALSIRLYWSQAKKPSQKQLIRSARPWIVLAVVINLLPLILFNLPSGQKENYDALAQCINEKGVNMYGSFRCGVCAKTRAMFGDSFEYINEIECHPQGKNAQTELCLSKGIKGTPTWILEPDGIESDRYTGFLSIDGLKEFSGCE